MIDKNRQRRSADPAETPDRAARKERFLSRWSRRKASARVEEETEHIASSKVTDETSRRPPSVPETIVEKTDADMPPVESLDADSDYAQFLSPKVSEQLRRTALRKLFHLPRYNVMDGLDTYIADYRHYAPLGDIVTADMRHEMERQAEAVRDAAEQQAGVVVAKVGEPIASASAATGKQSGQPTTPESGKEKDGPDHRDAPMEPDNDRGTSS